MIRIAISLMLLVSLALAASSKKPLAWQTGTLIDQSRTAEDLGCVGDVCPGTVFRTHYTIAADGKMYIANRRGSRLDVVVNAPIRFAIDGNTLYLMDAKGKAHDCHLEEERNRPAPHN